MSDWEFQNFLLLQKENVIVTIQLNFHISQKFLALKQLFMHKYNFIACGLFYKLL